VFNDQNDLQTTLDKLNAAIFDKPTCTQSLRTLAFFTTEAFTRTSNYLPESFLHFRIQTNLDLYPLFCARSDFLSDGCSDSGSSFSWGSGSDSDSGFWF
jgi:hypothetical protein